MSQDVTQKLEGWRKDLICPSRCERSWTIKSKRDSDATFTVTLTEHPFGTIANDVVVCEQGDDLDMTIRTVLDTWSKRAYVLRQENCQGVRYE